MLRVYSDTDRTKKGVFRKKHSFCHDAQFFPEMFVFTFRRYNAKFLKHKQMYHSFGSFCKNFFYLSKVMLKLTTRDLPISTSERSRCSPKDFYNGNLNNFNL